MSDLETTTIDRGFAFADRDYCGGEQIALGRPRGWG
jgi:hypothetical protein